MDTGVKMFQIKICGITSVDDAVMVTRAGADAIGLNFYAKSPRCVTTETARQIARAVPSSVTKVGLFVNATVDEVWRTFDDLKLDVIQLHGDEPPEFIHQLAPRPVMRAFRLGPGGLDSVFMYLDRCRDRPAYALLDALSVGVYGGTGVTVDWTIAREYAQKLGSPALVLAGGLVPANVAEAIQAVRPSAVDVASGVESSPGRKDPVAVAAFVQAARAAFANI
jgi:phosphoribosylanthranilate isomerase